MRMFDLLNEIENPKGTPLKYDDFKKYYIGAKGKGQWIFKFDNGYGASVIKHYGSCGYEEDLFELGVLHNDHLTYNTPITDNVIGYLTNEGVMEKLEAIKNL